jgi:hypothetical protein
MTGANTTSRFWVLGGRWAEESTRFTWPRVFGPYADYRAARSSALELSRIGGTAVRYLVVEDVPDPMKESEGAMRQQQGV